jgi:hypothetical protein
MTSPPLRAGFFVALVVALLVPVLFLLGQLSRVERTGVNGRTAGPVAAAAPLQPWEAATYEHVYFASPAGRPGNIGSAMQPLDLATALSADGPIGPGDLLWLTGGTYSGNFRSELVGTADAFIVVAQFPGDRVVLDGARNSNLAVLRVDGAYTVYWGFEVTNSTPDLPGQVKGTGVDVFGPYTKLINLVVHHTGNGLGVWTPALEAEVYGNLIYEVGWEDEDRGHGHSIYIQNNMLTKRVVDNILFDGHSFGVHAYTQGGEINNLYFEGNIAFDHGSRSKASGPKANFLVGGRRVAERPMLLSNYAYYPWSSLGRNADIGYLEGCSDPVVRGNYLAGGVALAVTNCRDAIVADNRLVGRVESGIRFRHPDNEYSGERPSTGRVFVRPSRYVRGRGHVAIFNWDRRRSVPVDLSRVGLRRGEPFEIRDVRDYFGTPLMTGRYGGTSVDLPLHHTKPVAPDDDASQLPPEFVAAVVLPIGRGATQRLPWNPSGVAHR